MFIYSPIHHFIDEFFSTTAYAKKRTFSLSNSEYGENILKLSIFFILLRRNLSFSKFSLLCFLKKILNSKHKNEYFNSHFYLNLLKSLAIWIKREGKSNTAYEKMAKIFGIEFFDFLNGERNDIFKKIQHSENMKLDENYSFKELNDEFLCKKQKDSCLSPFFFRKDEKLSKNCVQNNELSVNQNDFIDIISILSLFEYEINNKGEINKELKNFFGDILRQKNEELNKREIFPKKIGDKIETLFLNWNSDKFGFQTKEILDSILKEHFKEDLLYIESLFEENARVFQQQTKNYFGNISLTPSNLLKISFILKEICWKYVTSEETSEKSVKNKFYVLLMLQSLFDLKSSIVSKMIETKFLPLMKDFCYLAPKSNDFYRGRFIFESNNHSINKSSHSIFVLSLELIYVWASKSNLDSEYYKTYEEMTENDVCFHEKFIYLVKNNIKIRQNQKYYFLNEERQKLKNIKEKIRNLSISLFFKPNNFDKKLEKFLIDSDSMLLFLHKQINLRESVDEERTGESFHSLFEINEIVKISALIKNLGLFVDYQQLRRRICLIIDENNEYEEEFQRDEKGSYIDEHLVQGFYKKVLGNEESFERYNEYFIKSIENNEDMESLRILILLFKRLCLQPDQFPEKLRILKMIERLTKTKKPQILSIIEEEFLFLLPNEYSRNQEMLIRFERSEDFDERNKIYIKFKEYLFLIEDFVFDGVRFFSSPKFQNVYKFFISMELGVRERMEKIVLKKSNYNFSSQFSLVRTSDQSIKSERDDFE